MADVYIVDASPIILLGKIARLDLLVHLGSRILIPSAVIQEVQVGTDGAAILDELRKSDRVMTAADLAVPIEIVRWDLGAGESQVLSHALQIHGSEVVIDDLAARKCARTLGCETIGTVGAVLIGKKHGYITAVNPVLNQLLEVGLRLSKSALVAVLAAAGES